MSSLANAALALFLLLTGCSSALAQSFELLMYERAGCVHCARWNREVGPAYPLTPQGKLAPLRRMDLDARKNPAVPEPSLERPVRYSPTFVLLKDGREVGRITGYMDDAMFWGVFSKMLEQQSPKQNGDGS
jgi:thioredoxin-related protein